MVSIVLTALALVVSLASCDSIPSEKLALSSISYPLEQKLA